MYSSWKSDGLCVGHVMLLSPISKIWHHSIVITCFVEPIALFLLKDLYIKPDGLYIGPRLVLDLKSV